MRSHLYLRIKSPPGVELEPVEAEAAGKVQAECDSELSKAEPLVEKALGALDVLSKDAVGELKSFNNGTGL